MRQSASESGSSSTTEAQTALRRLEETRRQLEEARSDRARRDAQTAIAQVEELQSQQRDVQRRVRELPVSGAERSREIEQLRERKDQMTEAVAELERELDRSASSSSADNPEAARALQDGANHIRESKLKEKLQYSRGTIEQWDPQSAVTLELSIEADLQALRDELERASGAASQRERNPLEEALEEARDLVRGMEAMERRLREPGAQGQQQGQQGQQGQQQGNRQPGDRAGAIGGGGPDGWVDYNKRYSEAGAPTRGNPRPLSPEEIRQLQREFGQRGNQVRALREQLREVGRPAQELRAVLDAMERFQREGIYADPSQVAELHQEIMNQLKRLEFGLRRDVEGVTERTTTLSGSDEVPDGYRELVEEYYRALARGRPGGN
jgi:chromosome segregation ATPase